MILTPAYGRDYKSKAEVEKDFYGNKDFHCVDLFSQGYINRKDLIAVGEKFINVRYAKLRKVAVLRVEAPK